MRQRHMDHFRRHTIDTAMILCFLGEINTTRPNCSAVAFLLLKCDKRMDSVLRLLLFFPILKQFSPIYLFCANLIWIFFSFFWTKMLLKINILSEFGKWFLVKCKNNTSNNNKNIVKKNLTRKLFNIRGYHFLEWGVRKKHFNIFCGGKYCQFFFR